MPIGLSPTPIGLSPTSWDWGSPSPTLLVTPHFSVLQLGWSDTITAKASISEGMEAGSEQTIGLQRHVTDVSKCTYEATGVIGVYLSGSIWFKYKDYFRDPVCSQSLIQPGASCAGKDKSWIHSSD
ncbi:hypothetical protein B0H14DRAFT_2655366 [Mycena olivaceomarginata]|nr:hypothetical protein B0H14DRAFT_2655366 [Mycena olivaceomarginata]